MCTLIIAIGVEEEDGFYAIFNRDEVLGRPAAGPSLIQRSGMRILAPRDERAGGTWLGLNEQGVFAAITNRFGLSTLDHHRSRGLLVFEALEFEQAQRAVEHLRGLSPQQYNGFHLTVMDRRSAFVVRNDTERIDVERLEAGFHLVTERSFGAAESERERWLADRLETLSGLSKPTRRRLRQWMSVHRDDDPLNSTCVHLPDRNYGTRSSTVVEVRKQWQFAHAVGPPCSTHYSDYREEIDRLRGGGWR